MKKYVLIALALILLVPKLAIAASDESITKRRPDRGAQAEIQEIKEGIRSNIAENHVSRLTKRFDSYNTRFTNIITRFEARLIILDTEKKDTTDAKAKLALVKAKLVEAKAAGDAAILAFSKIDQAMFSEQKTERVAARELSTKAVRLYKEVLVLLKDALKALKVISKPALPAASAAVQNTN